MTARLSIFVGIAEDDEESLPRFYAEVAMTGIDLFVANSDVTVDNLSASQYLDELGKILNMAYLVAKQLGIEIVLDESIDEYAEETEEGLAEKCHKLLQEVL